VRTLKRVLLFAFVLFAIRWQTVDSARPAPSPGISTKLDSLRKADKLKDWLNTCMRYDEPNTSKYISFLLKEKFQIWRPCQNDSECLAAFYFAVTLGYYQMYTGNILGSIDSYEEAYQFSVEKKVPNEEVLEYVMKPLGNNYTRLGDYDRALFIQQKGLQVALSNRDWQQAASFYSNLTTTSLSKGDLGEAARYCDAGLQLVKKDSSLYGYFLSAQADVFFGSGKPKQASETIKEGISVLKSN
jgi:tetratricopeptide (TPR) repeat protein